MHTATVPMTDFDAAVQQNTELHVAMHTVAVLMTVHVTGLKQLIPHASLGSMWQMVPQTLPGHQETIGH